MVKFIVKYEGDIFGEIVNAHMCVKFQVNHWEGGGGLVLFFPGKFFFLTLRSY